MSNDTGVRSSGWNRGRVLALIAVGLIVLLCSRACSKRIDFTEEVQLARGELITVQRHVTAEPFGEIGGPGGWEPSYMSLEIVAPKRPDDPPKWESTSGLLPVLFDRDPGNGEWALLATFFSCDPWYALGRPKLPYAEFRVRNGQWQSVELGQQWIGRATNVFTGIRSSGEPDYLTLALKKKRDADDRIAPMYRSIVGQWSTGC
jgi:hypothetical protein